MLLVLSVWLLVAGFLGAGIVNTVGTPGVKSDFARWGYPRWWPMVTGGLEMVTAILIALPASRLPGLVLGAAIVTAAVLTVLRHRDYAHLLPLGVFIALMALALALS